MIYELAHFIKDKCSFVWDAIEWGNSLAFSVLYRKGLRSVGEVLTDDVPYPFEMRMIKTGDIDALSDFFSVQPEESFRFFQPHKFDRKSLRKVIRNHSFMAFILVEKDRGNETIVGYSFMRSFVNGSSYRGYMVDYMHQGKGIAKIMGRGMNKVGDLLHLKMYKSISPDNTASMKVTEAVCNIKVLKQLDNGDYLIKCMSKEIPSRTTIGGGQLTLVWITNQALKPQNRYYYAA